MKRDNVFYSWKKGEVADFTANFSTREMSCQCNHPSCVDQRIAVELVDKLQLIRLAAASPVRVHSAFRCRAHQADLAKQGYETAKGVSQHELGRAADISCSAIPTLQFRSLVKPHFKAVGTASSFLHVDLRSDRERTWSYSLPTRVVTK